MLCPLAVNIIIHLFSTPAYYALSPRCKPCTTRCSMQEKIERKDHLLESVSNKYEGSTHMAKTEFRLTLPLFAKLLNIKTKYDGAYGLQLTAGILFFYFLVQLVLMLTGEKVTTFLFSLAFGFIYPGFSFVAEMEGFFDSFAFLFLLVALLDVSILVIACFLFCVLDR